jgi:peptidyl-dipeptidase A
MDMRSSIFMALFLAVLAAATANADDDADFIALRDAFVARLEPLELESAAAAWETMTTGTEEAEARHKAADHALIELKNDREFFARLKALKQRDQVRDPVLRRELDVLYRRLLRAQGAPQLQARIVDLEVDVQQIFRTHRGRVGDRTLTANEVRETLMTTTNSAAAEAVYEGYMELGRKADAKLRELVKLRNEVARELGYPDYFSMSLALEETDEAELFRILDELDELTRAPFAQLKREIDASRAAHFGISIDKLRPWHFGDVHFQVVPQSKDVNLDPFYENADLPELCRRYYAGIGLSIDEVLANSDLYERPGKRPSGYTIAMDRRNNKLRVLTNLKPTMRWADTLLHELGHCMNDQYIAPDVPYLLRGPAHSLTTEGVAMMFGAMSKNGDWLTRVLKVDPADAERAIQAAREMYRRERLIFCRWALVMVHFERGMYSNPQQNLGKLWWDLKQRYQLLDPPADTNRPDYAAKMHILSAPVYYHSYVLGDLFAAQLRHYIARQILGLSDPLQTCFYGHPEVGAYFREKVSGPGNLHAWNDYVRRAMGEPLTAKYFALDLAQ